MGLGLIEVKGKIKYWKLLLLVFEYWCMQVFENQFLDKSSVEVKF